MFQGGADSLVFWSFRYFLGRRSAAAVGFAEELAKAWPMVNDKIKGLISNELNEEFESDDIARSQWHDRLPLGDDCERAAWQKVRDAYSK